MSEDARKGQRIVLIIGAALLVPELLTIVLVGWTRPGAFRAAFSIVLAFLLWKGYSWARSYLAFSLALVALLWAFAGFLALLVISPLAVVLLFPPLYAWAAWLLWSSPKVEAYIDYREKQRNPDMSFDSTGA